jgi:hypothetical protein
MRCAKPWLKAQALLEVVGWGAQPHYLAARVDACATPWTSSSMAFSLLHGAQGMPACARCAVTTNGSEGTGADACLMHAASSPLIGADMNTGQLRQAHGAPHGAAARGLREHLVLMRGVQSLAQTARRASARRSLLKQSRGAAQSDVMRRRAIMTQQRCGSGGRADQRPRVLQLLQRGSSSCAASSS